MLYKKGIPVLPFIIGLALVVFSLISIFGPKTDYSETTGTIVDIEEEYNIVDESYDHRVYVDYTVDGVKYERADYGSYSSRMKTGDTVTVLYDPADPTRIQAEGSEKVPYIVGAVGAVVMIFSAVTFIRRRSLV